jgi:IclR family mhp operon transcriptional activator
VARRLSLSPATTYRLLETLVATGYATKDPYSAHYSPAHQVLALSCGFEEEQWIKDAGKSIVQALGKEFNWPLALATPAGPSMLLRETTDRDSPLAVLRFAPGRHISLATTASGHAYLAFCQPERLDILLEMLSTTRSPGDPPAVERSRLCKALATVRRDGYAMQTYPQRVAPTAAIALPVMARGAPVASLSIRYAATAVKPSAAIQRFLPKLREAARHIGSNYARMVAEDQGRLR